MTNFSELKLKNEILKAITELGFEQPTSIQQKVIPFLLESTNDLKVYAQTGTGKTAAFGLPILQQLDTNKNNIQILILSPTRELCVQIANNMNEYGKFIPNLNICAVYGGASIDEQLRQLKKGCQIIVGTPGRTLDLLNRGKLKISGIKSLVLDEADEMLKMGFKDELDSILETTPKEKQTMMFSATYPSEVKQIAASYMNNPIEIGDGERNTGTDDVSHECYMITEQIRFDALKRILDANPDFYTIVFCRTRIETKDIAAALIRDGYNADALHGDLSQAQRDTAMLKFRTKTLHVLVATDVAARGLDVNDLTHIINYKLPEKLDLYTHRSGRTGRAGKKGTSIVFVTSREKKKIELIERTINKKFQIMPIPNGKEIVVRQLFRHIDKVKKVEINISEIGKFYDAIAEKLELLDRDEIIKRFISVEFNLYLSRYENSPDLNIAYKNGPKDNDRNSRAGSRESDIPMTRFFINLGKRDRIKPTTIISMINEMRIARNIEIGKIEMLDNFSFFEADKQFEDKIIRAFKGQDYKGRKIAVEVTTKERGGKPRNDEDEGENRYERRKRSFDSDKDFNNKPRREFNRDSKPSQKKNDVPDFKETVKRKPKNDFDSKATPLPKSKDDDMDIFKFFDIDESAGIEKGEKKPKKAKKGKAKKAKPTRAERRSKKGI